MGNHGFGWKCDCAFLCLAHGPAGISGKKVEGPSLEREAARLRLLAVNAVSKSRELKQFWLQDPHGTVQQRGGIENPATNFSEYCEMAANKNYYADGWLLQALAWKLKKDFVIWKFDEQRWESFLIEGIPQGKQKKPGETICLFKKDQHYRYLMKPDHKTTVPESQDDKAHMAAQDRSLAFRQVKVPSLACLDLRSCTKVPTLNPWRRRALLESLSLNVEQNDLRPHHLFLFRKLWFRSPVPCPALQVPPPIPMFRTPS